MPKSFSPRFLVLFLTLATLVCPGGSGTESLSHAQSAGTSVAIQAPSALRFGVVGDTGTGDSAQMAVAAQMLAEHDRQRFEFVLMLGDNLYSNKFSNIDRAFRIPYGDLLKRGVKFYATLGNHDQSTAKEQIGYSEFNMKGERWYSFAPAGDLVEFFTIDSTPLHSGLLPEQLDWLDDALEKSKAAWKIAFFHHPPYSPGSRHEDDPVMISRVVPVLKKHGVRIVFTGHEHFFAKLKTREGIDYIISGSGGKIHRRAINRSYDGLEAGNDQLHHFLVVSLTPDSCDVSAVGETGTVIFRGVIPRHVAKSQAATAR